jgi:hypothetical protein
LDFFGFKHDLTREGYLDRTLTILQIP